MYLSNYHTHCTFCDGRSYPEDFLKNALSKGMKSYGFSSHGPLPFDTAWTMNADDLPEYVQEIDRLKQKYENQIEIYLGLEVDYLDENHNATSPVYRSIATDYLISSIHYISHPVSKDLLCIDGNFIDFEQDVQRIFDGSIENVVRTYFAQTLSMIHSGGFDIVGHVDKIYMNGSRFAGFEKWQWLIDELMNEVLIAIKQTGLILEINTKSYHSKGITYPNQRHLNLVLTHQIPITINCDSHTPDLVLDGKREVANLLYEIGFRTTKEFIGGVWLDCELEV